LLPEYADTEMALQNVQTLLGLAAVLGHIFPIWADFRGGKGVATIFGMVLGISPITAVSCVTIFSLVLFLTRFVSLSSILAGISFPIFILVVFNVENPLYKVFAITVALLILIMHQKNIGRLLKGKEGKLPILKGRDRRREHQKK
jgi:glycerol-3-phosphate acyltransferase PlsY